MIAETMKLKTGEELTIKILHPPLHDYASKVGCWWSDIRSDLLEGQMTQWLFTPYFVGEIEGEVAGSMVCFTPAGIRDIGLVEFVHTEEKHRQKGVASALLARLIEHFRADGGLALYLCTGGQIAGNLYEKHGFWYNVGDGLRYLASGQRDFEKDYLAFCGAARVRDATWGDLPPASLLYNHSEPQWFIKDYLTQTFRDVRFESHFVRLMRRAENQKGALVVLENPEQRIVGMAVLERLNTFYEQHVATLSFRVCPGYFQQASELLNAAAQRAEELSIKILNIHIADCDDEQKELVKAAGFSEEARLRNRLRDGSEWIDMLIYTLSLPGAPGLLRNRGDYYGGRRKWQAERVASSDRDQY